MGKAEHLRIRAVVGSIIDKSVSPNRPQTEYNKVETMDPDISRFKQELNVSSGYTALDASLN